MESIRLVFLPIISAGCRVRSDPFQIQFWVVSLDRCIIRDVIDVAQLVQNWFTGILNSS